VRCLRIHGGERSGGNNVQNLERRIQLVVKKEKWPTMRDFGRWLAGDRGALAVALRRENARGGMRCETAGGDRLGYI
jgi:hypothetical protein